MDYVLGIFREAYAEENGHKLAESITPIAPPDEPVRLHSFYQSTTSFSIQGDLRNAIVYKSPFKITKAEANAWIEVYATYWKAIGELLSAEEMLKSKQKADWKDVYGAWKEMVNALIRGYTANAFGAWTIPCLYAAGKYLRNFAIKADEQARRSEGNVTYNEGFQDDVVGALGKNESLQDAARQVNRIFSLCISDRYDQEILFLSTFFACTE